jgi:uncharacterized protein (DUF58 family)
MSRSLLSSDANSRVSDSYYRNDIFAVLPYQRITRRLPFTCARRGFYSIRNIDLVCPSLLHTRKMVSHLSCAASLTVYPRILPHDGLPMPLEDLLGEMASRKAYPPDPFEFKGIRERQPQDSLRSLNFKATAKASRLMSNTYETTSARRALLMLNLEPYASWVTESSQEGSIRIAATVAAMLVDMGVPVRLTTNGKDSAGEMAEVASGVGSGHLERILDALAHIDLSNEAPPYAPFLRARALEEKGDLAYILISSCMSDDLREEFQRLKDMGADASWIVPAPKGEPAPPDAMGEEVMGWEIEPEPALAPAGG